MTSADLTPYWPATEDWAGFLLVIVPAGPLPVAGQELCRQVRARIEHDPVLYDLVTVRLAAPLENSAGWDRAFVNSLVTAAMPDRHYFAPRGVIGVVVVADDRETVREAYKDLQEFPAGRRLWARTFGAEVDGAGSSAERIAEAVDVLVAKFDEEPETALAEPMFLSRVRALLEEGHLDAAALGPEPEPAAPLSLPVPAPEPLQSPPAPVSPASTGPASSEPASAPQRLLEPVMYDGVEILTVDQRTPIQRLTGEPESDADAMEELRRDGSAVALVHFVFVPDDGVVPKAVAKRRNTIARQLDQLLDSVRRDALTGQPARVAIEVLSATNPLRKHGILRIAGSLTETALPKVKIEYFSATETTEPLLEAARRTARALHARGLEVASHHFVFLAAMRFPADETTEEDWVALLDEARVTWIDFSPTDTREPLHPMPPSPFGLHVLTDKEDVPAVVKDQSEALYGYGLPTLPHPLEDDEPGPTEATTDVVATRRWWQIGKRLVE